MRKLVLLFVLALSLIIAYQAHLLRQNKIDSSPDKAIETIRDAVSEQGQGVRDKFGDKFGDVHEKVLDKTKTVVSKLNDKLQNTTKEDNSKKEIEK